MLGKVVNFEGLSGVDVERRCGLRRIVRAVDRPVPVTEASFEEKRINNCGNRWPALVTVKGRLAGQVALLPVFRSALELRSRVVGDRWYHVTVARRLLVIVRMWVAGVEDARRYGTDDCRVSQ